jgi:hypothetical protein
MVKRVSDFLQKLAELQGRKSVPLILLLMVVTHLPYMKLPAVGNHVWRQCNTLAVAKNYADESMNLLEPRVDKRFEKSGITGPQFPAYEYILACLYRTVGFSEYYHRWLSLLFFSLAVWAMHNIILRYTGRTLYANIGALFMAFVPEMYFHGINAVPDVMALCCMLWGWCFALRWLDKLSWPMMLLSMLMLALAGMIKIQFLMAGLPIAVGFLHLRQKPAKAWFQGTVLAILAVGMSLAWYLYAAYLVKTYGLHEFVHAMRHARSLGEVLDILGKNLFSDIPETWVGYAFVPLLLAGIYKSKMVWNRYAPVVAYGLGCLLFYFPVQFQFIHHGYYAIVFMPLFAFIVGRGSGIILQSRFAVLLWVSVFLSPLWAWKRIAVNNWKPGQYRVPNEFVDPSMAQQLRSGNDASERWIVGPDISGCVYFYYTGSKGYPWYTADESTEMLISYVKAGAAGFITDQPSLLDSTRFNAQLKLRQVKKVGNMGWYQIEP